MTHPVLPEIDLRQAEKEFRKSNEAIYKITGVPVIAVSYPGGYANDEIFAVAEKYYNVGFMVGGAGASWSRAISLQRQTATEGIEIRKILKY
jgi:peptidoglycan/xylan/chitin deacetylase (PgdA/CDA1 family)